MYLSTKCISPAADILREFEWKRRIMDNFVQYGFLCPNFKINFSLTIAAKKFLLWGTKAHDPSYKPTPKPKELVK